MSLNRASVVWTDRSDGDFSTANNGLTPDTVALRRTIVDRPWNWLRQEHGSKAISVAAGVVEGEKADGLVSQDRNTALAIMTADCAPVAFADSAGTIIGAVHAGWRGIMAGVLENAIDMMRAAGATDIDAALGPCIHHCCYAFSPGDLDRVARRCGNGVRARTKTGLPSLDLPAAVRHTLKNKDVDLTYEDMSCTACSPEYFSYRADGEQRRHAMVVWM